MAQRLKMLAIQAYDLSLNPHKGRRKLGVVIPALRRQKGICEFQVSQRYIMRC